MANQTQIVDFLFATASVFLRQNRPTDGLVLAEAAYLMGGSSPQAIQFLSYARFKNGDFKGCLEMLEKVNSNQPAIHLLRAKALFELGNTSQSRSAINNYKATNAPTYQAPMP